MKTNIITNDYNEILGDISLYAEIPIKNIEIIEDGNLDEWITNKETKEKIKKIDINFWNWLKDPILSEESFINPTNYAKIMKFNEEKVSDMDGALFEVTDKNFYKLVKTPNPDYFHMIGERFHWSELVGAYDEIIEFKEEFEYWNKK